jgi:hypothetical protein
MKLPNKRKKENLQVTREEWEIFREYKKTPIRERFLKHEALWNTQ